MTASVASPTLASPAGQAKTRTSPFVATVEPKKAPADSERALSRERRRETQRGEAIARTALEYVGYPYRWGGRSPDGGFDCSGFTMFVYSTVGLELPRDLGGQLESGRWIEQDELIPGDLLIFANTYRRGVSHSAVYNAAKAGVISLMKNFARNYGRYGITANTVAPGAVEGFMTAHLTQEERDALTAILPLGRFAEPIEIARVVGFLASDDAGYITGATIDVNGGWIMT